MSSANYIMIGETGAYVMIQDIGPWDQYKTVTNAAEEVVTELTKMLKGRNLYYVDTDDRCDQLVHDGKGKFLGFKSGGPTEDGL